MTGAPTFARVCADHRHELVAFIRKMSGDRDRAEDVVQDAMIRAMRAWDTTSFARGEDMARVRAWLFLIAKNTYYHHLEAEKAMGKAHKRAVDDGAFTRQGGFHDPQASRGNGWNHDGPGYGWAAIVDDSDDVIDALSPFGDEVATAVAGLGDLRWEVPRRHYIDGDEYEHLVEDLKIAHGTLSSNLWRARVTLAKSLAEYARAEYGLRALTLGRTRVHAPADESPEVVEPDAGRVDRVVGDVERVSLGC